MNNRLRTNLIKYGCAVVLGGLLAWFYVSQRDFSAQPLVEKYRILCDAFTVPGLLMVLFAMLLTLSNKGAMDGVGYVANYALRMLIPGKGLQQEKFADYMERKRANRLKGYGFLYIAGIAFLAVAGVFMALFYSIYQK